MQLRYYQQDAVQSVYDYFSQKTGNPVIAMPTGTGKSPVIGKLCADILQQWPSQRILKLVHVETLVEQNADKLLKIWPQAPLGIYCAGLKRREASAPIVYGTVKSVFNNIEAFGKRDLVFVDEAHLVSPDQETMYASVFAELRKSNPKLKIIGLTATPYRLKQGRITDDGIFTDFCFDITGVAAFNRLIAEGFLCPLIPKATDLALDVSHVRTVAGDYNRGELEKSVDKEGITFRALSELLAHSQDRICGLIFATGIDHAEHINDMLQNAFGQSSVVIHSKRGKEENREAMQAWKSGAVKWAVSMNALTTGVDNPMIDVIGMLRPTLSPGLWVQMLGRGTRPSPETGKQNCKVLDFAGNTAQLGPINDPRMPRKKGQGTGEIPIRICEECNAYNHLSARFCCDCGHEFSFEVKFKDKAATQELIADGVPQVETFDVIMVTHLRHQKKDGSGHPMIRTTYYCDNAKKFDEWLCFDHPKGSFPRKKALDWLRQRIPIAPEFEEQASTDNVLMIQSKLRRPKRIRVWVNKQYPEVLGYEY